MPVHIALNDLPGAVLGSGVDHDDLQRPLLYDQGIEQVGDVPLLIHDVKNYADEHPARILMSSFNKPC